MTETFKPAWWLRSPHVQTLWSALFRKQKALGLVNETVELADGDFIDLCWSSRVSERTVLILHGLEGSLDSRYINGIIHRLEQAGYCPVLMHFRGCSGRPNRLPRAYHSGDTGDVDEIVRYITHKTGKAPYAAVGYSLGGNVLLKWLGETGESNPLSCAVAVSVPFVLSDAANRLDHGFSVLYRMYLLRALRQSYRNKFSNGNSPLQVDIDALKTFWEYDDKVTAPLHGFSGVDEYYRLSSSRQYLKTIRTPVRIIHALDDPFMYATTVPGDDEVSADVDMLITRYGGHVGFIDRPSLMRSDYWSEEKIIEFLDSKK
jgi:predicted alpha/beta-fold hydrolase